MEARLRLHLSLSGLRLANVGSYGACQRGWPRAEVLLTFARTEFDVRRSTVRQTGHIVTNRVTKTREP